MRSDTVRVISSSAQSNAPGIVVDAFQITQCSAQIVSTGLIGTVIVQASNDRPQDIPMSSGLPAPVHWSPIPSATVSVTGAGIFLIPQTLLSYRYVQCFFTYSSGSGNINVNMTTQGPS